MDRTELADALKPLGPLRYISWDEETDYFQVYGDNGTICTTDAEENAIAITTALQYAIALADA